ncbi:hypothetical protein [Neisseria maigaei]|uniref:hypothetical protein n=1 Tax=Neisseria maigaei TaxID=2830651 RepID=UPI0026580F66|nr:hypothetical protein [Neisseria maigaei]
MNRQKYPNRHSRAGGNPDWSARKLIGKKGFSGPESWIPTFVGMTAVDLADAADLAGLNPSYNPLCPLFMNPPPSRKTQKMPSENLSDGIFAGKSVKDFAPA